MPKNYSKYNWYVVTGGPSSGKTTLLKELEKLGCITYHEAARSLIDQEMAKGKLLEEIRSNEAEFQRKVFKIKIQIEKKAPRNKIVFFDRGIPDSIAYYQICGLDPKEVLKFCKRKIYKKIFFLEQLSFDQDYARTEDDKTIEKLNKLLKENYKKLGYEVIEIPVMPIRDRLLKILKEIDKI